MRELLVVADSDREGAALAYALPDGPARKLTLPVDLGVTDDVEGIAWRAGHLYALVSTGFVERFTPARDRARPRRGRLPDRRAPLHLFASDVQLGPAPRLRGALPSSGVEHGALRGVRGEPRVRMAHLPRLRRRAPARRPDPPAPPSERGEGLAQRLRVRRRRRPRARRSPGRPRTSAAARACTAWTKRAARSRPSRWSRP